MKKLLALVVRLIYFPFLVFYVILEAFFPSTDFFDYRITNWFFTPLAWTEKHWRDPKPRAVVDLLEEIPQAHCVVCLRPMDEMEHNYGAPEYWCCIHCYFEPTEQAKIEKWK